MQRNILHVSFYFVQMLLAEMLYRVSHWIRLEYTYSLQNTGGFKKKKVTRTICTILQKTLTCDIDDTEGLLLLIIVTVVFCLRGTTILGDGILSVASKLPVNHLRTR